MAVTYIFSLIFIALSAFYIYLRSKYDYWRKKNIKYLKPTLIFGNYADFFLQKKTIGEVVQNLCKKCPNEPYFGVYYGTQPALVIQDPELIKTVTSKDFYYFNSREIMDYAHCELINRNLFFTSGGHWKVMRQNFSPLFSPARMKNMFHLIEKCAHTLEDMLDNQMQKLNVIESKCTMARYTMDMIGSCVFGIEMNTLTEDPGRNMFLRIGELTFENSIIRAAALSARSAWPGVFYGVGLRAIPKSITNFFQNLVTGVFEARQYKPSPRNDFIDLLLSFRDKTCLTADDFRQSNSDKKLVVQVNEELLTAQGMMFFAAGYETSSAAMSFALYELAKNEDAQSRAQQEIDDYLRRHSNRLDYECINELPYLEACVNEAMRLYPALGVIIREVVKDYTLPTGLKLERGLRIHLPLYHLHHDPHHFSEPETFRPERFIEDKEEIKQYTYMPFGEGPRQCIGMRFSRMETMSGLITVLKKYRVQLAEDMPRKVELDPRHYLIHAKGELRLKLVPREDWQLRQYDRSSVV